MAADSRVAIDVLQTGGLIGDDMTFHLRGLSEMTGGMASISEYSRLGLERLDAATRTSYLLGYYPTNGKWDGAFRTITVKVNRPGVTLVYRRGYNARVVPPVFDRVEYASRFRIESAAALPEDVKDIGVTLSASLATENNQTFADVSAQIDPAALRFDVRDGIIVGRITIAVVPMDANRAIIGGQVQAAGGESAVRQRDAGPRQEDRHPVRRAAGGAGRDTVHPRDRLRRGGRPRRQRGRRGAVSPALAPPH